MGHIGIIAEYNPFHKGHLYQINSIRKIFPDKNIIICMSGNYVQRGEPAIFPISLRTKCALSGGADLVIEMPSVYSSASSEIFASAGVLTLAKTGVVDTLCFGAECDDISTLDALSNFFLNESDDYKKTLKSFLSTGISYPKARGEAASLCLKDESVKDVLNRPNNILAIEYIKAIKKHNLPIKPYIIKRTANNHDSLNIDNDYCSSSALRNAIYKKNEDINSLLIKQIPHKALNILNNSSIAKPIFFDDFYLFLQYRLLNDNDKIIKYFEVSNDLCNKINNINIFPNTLNELMDLLSGKQITNARIRRCLLNILLGRTNDQIKEAIQHGYIEYIRILGAKENTTDILKEMKKNCSLPLINKTSYCKKQLSKEGLWMFEREVFENNIYRQVFYNKYNIVLPTDYEQSVIIL